MKTRKHWLLPMLCAALVLGAFILPARAASGIEAFLRPDITIIIDGSEQIFYDAGGQQVYPISYNGTTYLPVRAIGELMGKSVGWDGTTNTITLSDSEAADATSGGTGDAAKPAAGLLSLEDAKAKVLTAAGLTAGQATFTKAKLEWDDGRQVYDLAFYANDYNYKYEIDAKTGEILDSETVSGTPLAGTVITCEKAREIALAKVPGANASHVKKLKLDRDGGKQVYEVEIVYNGVEYEMEIDAVSGKVLKFEAERD